jgi:hypothetical protein
MDQRNAVLSIIFRALTNLNEELPTSSKVPINVEIRLFGANAALDSLSLVSVVIDVETAIADELGHTLSLTDDRAMNQEVSPFEDVRSLTAYILLLLGEKG